MCVYTNTFPKAGLWDDQLNSIMCNVKVVDPTLIGYHFIICRFTSLKIYKFPLTDLGSNTSTGYE